jgi:hypothetical protein
MNGDIFEMNCFVIGNSDQFSRPLIFFPNGKTSETSLFMKVTVKNRSVSVEIEKSNRLRDEGTYTCKIFDTASNRYHTFSKNLIFVDAPFINLSTTNDKLVSKVSETAKVVFTLNGYPKPTVEWFISKRDDPGRDELTKSWKRVFEHSDDQVVLEILKTDVSDAGNFTLRATNGNITKEKTIELKIEGKHAAVFQHLNIQSIFF